MRVVILNINRKRSTGLESWKKNLVKGIPETEEITEVYVKDYFELIKNLRILFGSDIVHSYSQQPEMILIMLVRKLFKKKNIQTVHGNYYEEQSNKKGLKKLFWIPFNKLCNKLADKVTFPSQYLMTEITKKEPQIIKKSVVIPNGIDIEEIKEIKPYTKQELGLTKNDFLILEVTNFNLKQKADGVNQLVRDFLMLKGKSKKNPLLYIMGGGRLLEDYKKKYESKRIKFLGFKKDVISYIKSADLFVHYSYLESFGYVLLEAMASEKPVLAYGAPAFEEVLGSKLIRLNKLNFESMDSLIKKSKKIIERYNNKKMGENFLKVYKEAINSKK